MSPAKDDVSSVETCKYAYDTEWQKQKDITCTIYEGKKIIMNVKMIVVKEILFLLKMEQHQKAPNLKTIFQHALSEDMHSHFIRVFSGSAFTENHGQS